MRRGSVRRRNRRAQREERAGVLGVQVVLCVALLCAAVGLQASEIPFYEKARISAAELVGAEAFSPGEAAWAWAAGLLKGEAEEGEPLEPDGQDFQEKMETLRGYIHRYLPAQAEGAESGGFSRGAPMADGGQGGALPAALSPARKSWSAPEHAILSPVLTTARAWLPLKQAVVTCRFGYRYHPITGEADFHTGIDLGAQEGEPVAAVYPGVVEERGESEIYGNYLVLRHGGSMRTFYGHCSELLAPAGARIRQGETIARVGSTGVSTGPHLHFEVRFDETAANPWYLFFEGREAG
ncbi:MAG: M23 family metallopeptidase [Oscillospiraceae bacterium]|nr:M23 family metallopeptidase [Oscillospiraceae bacterium]